VKKLFAVVLILILSCGLFAACKPAYSFFVNGDIAEGQIEIKLSKDKPLDEILAGVTPRSVNYKLMITAQSDGTSALISGADAKECTVILGGNGALNISAPKHPPVARIKDILEITVICAGGDDFRVVYPYGAEYFSYGEAKLLFYTQSGGEQSKDEYTAVKYLPNSVTRVDDFVEGGGIYAYFDDFSVEKVNAGDALEWSNGRICAKGKAVFGFVAGADNFIGDAYYAMKDALDGGKKVITVLADGLSLEQVMHYAEHLSLLKSGYKFAASTHPARSNVALASIVTGKDPKETGITTGGFSTPLVPDIFAYASSAKYIEGNSNLIGTSLEPVLAGKTDLEVFGEAKRAGSPDLLFVHFHGIDDVNHEFTPFSNEALEKILEIEAYINALTEGFSGRVIIISDHGHVAEGGHGYFMPGDMLVPYYVIDL